jgi:hypothetical protein
MRTERKICWFIVRESNLANLLLPIDLHHKIIAIVPIKRFLFFQYFMIIYRVHELQEDVRDGDYYSKEM